MNHSQARFPHSDIGGRFAYDETKDELEAASTSSTGASHHELQAGHSHTSDLGSDDDEDTIAQAEPDSIDLETTPRLTASSVQDELLTASTPSLDRTAPHVRFRSRVRISAGMSRRRRLSDTISSSASSISGSSSISAPLRTHPTGKNGWGTLGSRVNPLSSHAAVPVRGSQHTSDGKDHDVAGSEYGNPRTSTRSSLSFLDDDVNEHTHLVTTATTHSYVRDRYAHDWCLSERERERRWKEQLMDEAFGKWPARLLNRHWWWWHMEPVLCFLCDDSDEEE